MPTPTLTFMRHGHKASNAPSSPLCEAGRAGCLSAAAWMVSLGATPTRVRVTRTRRSAETAERVLAAMGLPQTGVDWAPPQSLPRAASALTALFDAFFDLADKGDELLIVGHGQQQRLIEQQLGGANFAVPASHRGAAFRLQRRAGRWQVVAAWPGTPA